MGKDPGNGQLGRWMPAIGLRMDGRIVESRDRIERDPAIERDLPFFLAGKRGAPHAGVNGIRHDEENAVLVAGGYDTVRCQSWIKHDHRILADQYFLRQTAGMYF